jgi:orotidine-5'-phosphate decarboxylase
MLSAAREAVPAGKKTRLIAVTLLTSMGPDDLQDIGLYDQPEVVVTRLTQLTRDCGLDGVVCSAREAAGLRQMAGKDFCLVTPGIRLANAVQDDQSRIATPCQAIKDGADYLVIGRPVTQAVDPLKVLQQISDDIALI